MILSPLLARLSALLEEMEIPYAIIGGQAVVLHGEPRLTVDVDAVIAADHSIVARIIEAAPRHEFQLPAFDLLEFVQRTSVLVLFDSTGDTHIDLAFGWTPYEHEAIGRAVPIEMSGAMVRFATPEDLILHKMFASRPQDLEDVKGILLRQRGGLDLEYINSWLPQLAEVAEDPEVVATFSRLVAEFYSR